MKKTVMHLFILVSIASTYLYAAQKQNGEKDEKKEIIVISDPHLSPYHSLYMAAARGDLDVVKKFINNQPKCFLDISKEHKNTPLILAARNGHKNVVTYLLEQYQKHNNVFAAYEHLTTKNYLEQTAADWAREKNHHDIMVLIQFVEKKLEEKLDSEQRGGIPFKENKQQVIILPQENLSPSLPLHAAAAQGNLNAVKRLIQKQRIYLYVADSQGNTPLHYATLYGHHHVVEYLLRIYESSLSHDVNPKNKKLYLQRNYYFITKPNNIGKTALQVAQEKGYSAIQILLHHSEFFLKTAIDAIILVDKINKINKGSSQ